mgnify:FL=1
MKYIKLSLIATLLLAISTSCFKMEEEDIFDDNAVVRLDKAIANYKKILNDKGGKWMLEYYSNSGEAGYIYLMSFNDNGSVTISGKNEFIGEVLVGKTESTFGSESSMWDVIGDNGPVLTFNTYNNIFHIFANPEDIGQTDTDEQGYGHRGDYEFDIMKYSNDTLYLDGKKYEIHMLMTRVDNSVNDEEFFAKLDVTKASFSPLIKELYLTAQSGQRYICTDASTGLWSIYPEGGDKITETQTFNAIVTPTGLRFMRPLSILPEYGDFAVQDFKFDDSGLIAEDGQTTIRTAPLGELFSDIRYSWRINTSLSKGTFLDAYNAVVAGCKSYNSSTLEEINFTNHVVSPSTYGAVHFRSKLKSSTNRLNCYLYKETKGSGYDVDITMTGEGDKNALVYRDKVPAMKQFVQLLNDTSFRVETDNPLAPTTVRLIDKNNSENYFTLSLYIPV